jgi:ketosteroid isomerase-like protein
MKRVIIAVLILVVAAAGVAYSRPSAEADASALMNADQDFSNATGAKGLDGFASFLAEDASTLRPDKPVVAGKAAVTEAWRGLLTNPALAIRWKPLTAKIAAGRDLGYTLGTYEITRTDEKGKQMAGTGKYCTIWRKQSDGTWKVEFDSGVNDTPPAAPGS